MGISVSAGTAVILVGVFLMLGIVVPGTLNAHDRVTSATDVRDEIAFERAHTALSIDDVAPTADGLRANVTNEGTTSLTLSETDVIVDNAHASVTNTSVSNDSETDLWLPGETAELTIATSGSGSLVVVAGNGVDDRTSLEGI